MTSRQQTKAQLTLRSSALFARRFAPGVFFLALTTVLTAACAPTEPPPPGLPSLNLDPARVSVSGLSSGAYMAQQLHLAYSDHLIGAGLLAGGPYGCARGDLRTALAECTMPDDPALPAVAPLIKQIHERAGDGRLAPLAGLSGDRVWVYHGSADSIVSAAVTEASAAIYEQLDAGVELVREFDKPYEHLLPTAAPGDDCIKAEPPYIGRCAFDAAGQLFGHLYGSQEAPSEASGQLLRFDSRSYAVDGENPPGLDYGYLYLPTRCTEGESCGLHIALHGCEQSAEVIDDLFAASGDFNRWADAADVVVLYPQAQSSYSPLNPKGCWDWWGYTGDAFDTRDGAQMRWIARMAAALGAPIRE